MGSVSVRFMVVRCQSWLVEILLYDLDGQATDSHLETQLGRHCSSRDQVQSDAEKLTKVDPQRQT